MNSQQFRQGALAFMLLGGAGALIFLRSGGSDESDQTNKGFRPEGVGGAPADGTGLSEGSSGWPDHEDGNSSLYGCKDVAGNSYAPGEITPFTHSICVGRGKEGHSVWSVPGVGEVELADPQS